MHDGALRLTKPGPKADVLCNISFKRCYSPALRFHIHPRNADQRLMHHRHESLNMDHNTPAEYI